ncbi:MAG: hypothetical protein ABSE39_08910 [Candidatus Bathyarchaeia archaeon]
MNTIVNSGQVDRLLKDYLEAKLRSTFDYLAIEGKMTPDPNGDIGVTGNYRKKLSDKNVFFTATINVEARTVQNLREY